MWVRASFPEYAAPDETSAASGYDIFGMKMQPRGKRGFLVREKAGAFVGEDFFYKSLLDE